MKSASSRSGVRGSAPSRTGTGLRWRAQPAGSIRLKRARTSGCHVQYRLYASRRRPSRRGGRGKDGPGRVGTETGRMSGHDIEPIHALNRFSAPSGSNGGLSSLSPLSPTTGSPELADRTAPRRVIFVASECEPWAKTGGLADVVDALARALGRTGGGGDVYLPPSRPAPP